ncbi:Ger(x)C family spore germination protein [Paenibacillus sp. PL2-23]|uniref:Ger(x)C family spore germination protein n=1 Tax=Paenibacillus sp. PL2-23 TaxID=2100729 RepID=UPI0030FA6F2E
MNNRIGWIFIALLVMAVLAAGCNQPYVVDRISMVNALGLDKQGDQYLGTAIYSEYDPKEKLMLTQGAGQTTQLIRQMQMHEPKPLRLGKLHMLLFSRELAEEGIIAFIHSICRDPLISSLMNVAVSDLPAERLMKGLEKKGGRMLPHKLIEQNVKEGNLPETSLHRFLFDYYGPGRDAFMPYLGLDRNESLEVKGIAIYRDDKLKLVLGNKDAVSFKMLQPSYRRAYVEIQGEGQRSDVPAVLSILSGKTRLELARGQDGASEGVVVHSTITGLLKEQLDPNERDEERSYDQVERVTEAQLEQRLYVLLRKFQTTGVDPVGIGDFMRSRHREWQEETFYADTYPELKLAVKVNVKLKESGVGE